MTIEEALEYKLSYGKFKNVEFGEIPIDYLRWLATEHKDDMVATVASNALEWRLKYE